MRQRGRRLAIVVRPAASLLIIAGGEASARRSRELEHGLRSHP